MAEQEQQDSSIPEGTVTILGGGLAGLASAIHLARLDFRVLCIEAVPEFERIVGESLDWSAPKLLGDLGLTMEELVRKEICTYKRHVRLEEQDGSRAEYIPSEWLSEAPFRVELRTLHVDRLRLHAELLRIASEHGVVMLHDRVTEIARHGERILSVRTRSGRTIASDWFVDASGYAASLLGRELRIPKIEFGPQKVAFWAYLSNPAWNEGTTLYAESAKGSYMSWVWKIPTHPGTVSLGYVTSADDIKRNRANGAPVEALYREQVSKFEALQALALAETGSDERPVYATTFRCRTYRRVCGTNWIIVGEAASVPDPITGNGVTAAMRHAAEGAQLIRKSRRRGRISRWSQCVYNLRVRQMGEFFNSLIEKLAYDWPIRDRFGLLKTGDLYTIPAWSVNYLYTRVQPTGTISTFLFSGLLCVLRAATWAAYQMCRLLAMSSRQRIGGLTACT